MSHHARGYRIYPDDETDHSNEQWAKSDSWINGLEFRRDYNEAMALAKVGAISCGMPFVVQIIPIGGKRPKYAEVWVVKS